jgi:hypothetical protein
VSLINRKRKKEKELTVLEKDKGQKVEEEF